MQEPADPRVEPPWLSIVTAVLDAPEHLRATVECIQQSNCGVEHIIIDGASDAPTRAVLARAQENGARVLSEPDRGIYQALNKGLRLARGEYICVLHAGDRCAPQALRSLESRLVESSDGLDVIHYGDCKLGDRKVIAPGSTSPAMNLYNLSIAHQSMIVPRRVYAAVGNYREDFRIVSDHIWMRAAYQRGVAFRKLAGWCVELDDAGLSSGRTEEDRLLFEREIVQRTRIYYPFLPERICRAVFDARSSEAAREELRRFVSAPDAGDSCEPSVWRELQESVRDYVRIFGGAPV